MYVKPVDGQIQKYTTYLS